MTNTSEYVSMEEILGKARERGAEDGKDAGLWAFNGNTDQDRLALCVRLDEDGDPEWDDWFGARAPLSGEFADDLTPDRLIKELGYEDLTDEEVTEVCDEYEEAYYAAHRDEVLRAASYQLND